MGARLVNVWCGAIGTRSAELDLHDGVELRAPSADGPDHVADRVDIDAALEQLPPEFRAAVVLRDLCGLDYAEIAECLAIPPGTARSRISRGRGMLAEILGNPRPSPDVQGTER